MNLPPRKGDGKGGKGRGKGKYRGQAVVKTISVLVSGETVEDLEFDELDYDEDWADEDCCPVATDPGYVAQVGGAEQSYCPTVVSVSSVGPSASTAPESRQPPGGGQCAALGTAWESPAGQHSRSPKVRDHKQATQTMA